MSGEYLKALGHNDVRGSAVVNDGLPPCGAEPGVLGEYGKAPVNTGAPALDNIIELPRSRCLAWPGRGKMRRA